MRNAGLFRIYEKLLLAAYELEERNRRPFSAEDLVVTAWQKFPDAFGLAGYRSDDGHLMYPDSNRVYAEIMGSKPIRRRGLLVKMGHKMYQLTEGGREHARFLLGSSSASGTEKSGLPRDVQQQLQRLLTSKAAGKVRNGRAEDLTFHDACVFWGISPRSSAIEFNGRVANFNRILEAARKTVEGKTATFEHGGKAYRARDLDDLMEVHQQLQTRFRKEIEVIQKRTDRRT